MIRYQRFDPRAVAFGDVAERTLVPAKAAKVAKVTQGLLSARAARRPTLRGIAAAEATLCGWSVEDWRAFFDERVFVAETDGGLPRQEAGTRAFEGCIIEWLNRDFITSSPDRCAECRRTHSVSNPLLPHGVESAGHAWLHSSCWSEWHGKRRMAAIGALTSMGIAAEKVPDMLPKDVDEPKLRELPA